MSVEEAAAEPANSSRQVAFTPILVTAQKSETSEAKTGLDSGTTTRSIHTGTTSKSITTTREFGDRQLKHLNYDELHQELTDSTLKEHWHRKSLQANIRLGCKVLTGGIVAFTFYRLWWVIGELVQDDECTKPMTTIKWIDFWLEAGFGVSMIVALCFPRRNLYYGLLCLIGMFCGLFSFLPMQLTCDEIIDMAVCKQSDKLIQHAIEAECSPQGESALSFCLVIIITSPFFVPHFRTTTYFLSFLIAMVGVATVMHRIAFFSYHNGWDCLISFVLLAGAGAIALRKKYLMQRREMSLCIVESRRQHATEHVYYLLKNMVPEFIVPRLLEEPPSLIADSLECVSISFIMISDIHRQIQDHSPAELLGFLNIMFTRIDSFCRARHVTKIETVGEEYVAAVGIAPGDRQELHQASLGRLIQMNLDVLRLASEGVSIRMGIHTGPVVAGVIGYKLPRFRLFGPTVNMAARMMQKGVDGELQFGEATEEKLPAWVKTRGRGAIDMKGLGKVAVYFLDQQATRACQDQDVEQRDGLRSGPTEGIVKIRDADIAGQNSATSSEGCVTSAHESDPQPVQTRDKSGQSFISELSRNNSSSSFKEVVKNVSESLNRESLESDDAGTPLAMLSISSKIAFTTIRRVVRLDLEQHKSWMATFYEKRLYRNLRRQAIAQFMVLLVVTIIEILIASSEPVFERDSTAEAYFVSRALLLVGLPFWAFVVYHVRRRTRESPRLLETWRLLGLCLATLSFSISYCSLQQDKDVSGMSAPQIKNFVLSRPYRIRIWELMSLFFFSTLVINVTLRFSKALLVVAAILAIKNLVQYIVLEQNPFFNLSMSAAEVSACCMALLEALSDEQNDRRDFKESLMLDIVNHRIEGLLKMLLPPIVVDDLTTQDVKAAPPSHIYTQASVAQSDLAGFTQLCKNLKPEEVIRIVENLFGLFDDLAEAYGVYKVETVGDAYIAGMAERPLTSINRVVNVLMFARGIIEITQRWSRDNAQEELDCRVGVHFGSCIGGIVGRKMRRYHLFGKLLSELELLESTAPLGKIHISKACWDAVQAQLRRERLPDLVVKVLQRHEPLFTSKNDPVEYDQVGGGPTLIVQDIDVQTYPLTMEGQETQAFDVEEYPMVDQGDVMSIEESSVSVTSI